MNNIFIIGCPRSGTSLTGRILGACKDTSYWEESHVIVNMIRSTGFTTQDEVDNLLKFATMSLGTKSVDMPDPNYNLFHSFLDAGITIEPKLERFRNLRRCELVRELLNFFDELGFRNWVEKSPPHTFLVDIIKAHFPNCKILHVCRHPLDTLSSIKEWSLKHYETWTPESACKMWNEHFAHASIKSDISIKYRDVTFHKLLMKQLAEKLELTWTSDCDKLYDNVKLDTVNAWEKRLTRKEIWTAFKLIDWQLAERGGFFPY